jgi:hypothetical protein
MSLNKKVTAPLGSSVMRRPYGGSPTMTGKNGTRRRPP